MKHLNCKFGKLWQFALLVLVFGLTSCDDVDVNGSDDFVLWDFANTSVVIRVENAQGANLLNPEQEGNITGNTIKAIYGDKTFVRDADLPSVQTRFNMPHWLGLYTYENKGEFYLAFGEFSPTSDYHNSTFTIDWGDGTTDVIGFDYYITWKKDDPTVHFATYLNGEKVEKLKIVK